MNEKMWSINVFAKDKDGNYSKDLYGPKYKWSYDNEDDARNSFNKIVESKGLETLCELIEYDFESSDLIVKETKYSNHFAGTYIIPGKYQSEIK